MRREEALDGLDNNCENEGQQKDTVDQHTKLLSTLPPVGALLVRPTLLGETDPVQTDDECEHVGDHVERVGNEGHRACHLTDNELKQEEEGRQKKHEENARLSLVLVLMLMLAQLGVPVDSSTQA